MENSRNRRIDEILGSLDGVKRAAAPDFFFTRLKARMEKNLEPETRRSWVLRPVYAIAAVIIVVLLNAAVVLNGSNNTTTATAPEGESIQSIAAEYNLNDNISEEVYR